MVSVTSPATPAAPTKAIYCSNSFEYKDGGGRGGGGKRPSQEVGITSTNS